MSWPKNYPNIDDMVQAGFYFTGSEDAAACLVCGVVLEAWEPENVPLEEHKKESPFCDLLKLKCY